MQNDAETIMELQAEFGDSILPVIPFPRAFCTDKTKVKAIYLGCDPSNKHSHTMPYAFAINSALKVFNKFLHDHTSNLSEVGLSWDRLYVQNLCRNYFKVETADNLPVWKKTAKYWIPRLKEELSEFRPDIPVLLTSAYLYDVLMREARYKPTAYYSGEKSIPIPPESNYLDRPLIPFYRNRRNIDYHLSNPTWSSYKEKIREIIT